MRWDEMSMGKNIISCVKMWEQFLISVCIWTQLNSSDEALHHMNIIFACPLLSPYVTAEREHLMSLLQKSSNLFKVFCLLIFVQCGNSLIKATLKLSPHIEFLF